MNDEQAQIHDSAIRMLSLREHSRFELRRKLAQKKQFAAGDIEPVLDALQADGLQSDHRFAEQYIRSRSNKGYGPNRIRLELKEKGISDDLASIGFEQSEIDWFELVRQVKHKKFKDKIATDWQEKSKQIKFLDYRGFTQEQIRTCVDENEYD